MKFKLPVFAVCLLCAGPSAWSQAPPPPADERPAKLAPPSLEEASQKDGITAEQAIRLATEALDRLESETDDAKSEALVKTINDSLKIVQDKDPTNPWLSYLYGRAHVHAGRRWDAIQQFRSFVESAAGRNEWRAYRMLGDLFEPDWPRLAQADYEMAATLTAGEPSVLFGLSRCAKKLGKLEDAERLGRQAVEADGRRNLRFLSHLVTILRAGKQWEKATQEAEAALRLAREAVQHNPGTRGPLDTLYTQYGESIGLLAQRAIEDSAADAEVYVQQARYSREQAQLAQQLRLYDLLKTLESGIEKTASPTSIPLLEQYGQTLADLEQTEAAVRVFQEILAREPSNKTATEQLARLQSAKSLTPENRQP